MTLRLGTHAEVLAALQSERAQSAALSATLAALSQRLEDAELRLAHEQTKRSRDANAYAESMEQASSELVEAMRARSHAEEVVATERQAFLASEQRTKLFVMSDQEKKKRKTHRRVYDRV